MKLIDEAETAEDVVGQVIAHAKRVQFGVVVRVPLTLDKLAGNLAVPPPLFTVTPGKTQWDGGALSRVNPVLILMLRAPVFVRGEILVLDADGREISGRGRKPSKWDVDVETFDTIEEAVARARAFEASIYSSEDAG